VTAAPLPAGDTKKRFTNRARAWLPEGRALPEGTWRRRHAMIVRFALIQAIAIGLYGYSQHFSIGDCLSESGVVAVPALLASLDVASRRLRTISSTVSLMFACAVAVDFAHGVTEAHFLFFVMIGIRSRASRTASRSARSSTGRSRTRPRR